MNEYLENAGWIFMEYWGMWMDPDVDIDDSFKPPYGMYYEDDAIERQQAREGQGGSEEPPQ